MLRSYVCELQDGCSLSPARELLSRRGDLGYGTIMNVEERWDQNFFWNSQFLFCFVQQLFSQILAGYSRHVVPPHCTKSTGDVHM